MDTLVQHPILSVVITGVISGVISGVILLVIAPILPRLFRWFKRGMVWRVLLIKRECDICRQIESLLLSQETEFGRQLVFRNPLHCEQDGMILEERWAKFQRLRMEHRIIWEPVVERHPEWLGNRKRKGKGQSKGFTWVNPSAWGEPDTETIELLENSTAGWWTRWPGRWWPYVLLFFRGYNPRKLDHAMTRNQKAPWR